MRRNWSDKQIKVMKVNRILSYMGSQGNCILWVLFEIHQEVHIHWLWAGPLVRYFRAQVSVGRLGCVSSQRFVVWFLRSLSLGRLLFRFLFFWKYEQKGSYPLTSCGQDGLGPLVRGIIHSKVRRTWEVHHLWSEVARWHTSLFVSIVFSGA